MKKPIFLFLGLILTGLTYSQTVFRGCELSITFSFAGIVEGYEYDTKTKVFIDGVEAGESPVVKESKVTTFKVKVPTGYHDVRIVNYAHYDGRADSYPVDEISWEEHTKENNYSVDAFFEGRVKLKKDAHCRLVFDIDNEVTNVDWE